MNPLAGRALDYCIGADDPPYRDGRVLEVGYDAERAPISPAIKYGNLFLEKYGDMTKRQRAAYAPFLHTSDTAQQYNEGQIDPAGPGWWKNIDKQIERAKADGWSHIEWDNPDAYSTAIVLPVYNCSLNAGLRVIAKNPLLVPGTNWRLLAHAAVDGAIVEKDAGTPAQMDALRRNAGKPKLPVWFVSFGHGRPWAEAIARTAWQYKEMYVTYSPRGEYGSSEDVTA